MYLRTDKIDSTAPKCCTFKLNHVRTVRREQKQFKKLSGNMCRSNKTENQAKMCVHYTQQLVADD